MRKYFVIVALCLWATSAIGQEPAPTPSPEQSPAQPAAQDPQQAERERKEREKQEKAAKEKAKSDAKAAKEAEAKAAQSQPAGEKVAMASSAEQELTRLTDEYIVALKGKDSAALERIWSDDLTFITPGGVMQTKAQRLADIKSGATRFDTLDAAERTVRVYGDTAVITTLTTIKGQYSGQEASGQYRVTQVLVKRGGAWQIVALQMSPVGTTTPAGQKP